MRFLFLWIFFTSVIYAFRYIFNKEEKEVISVIIKRLMFAGFISTLIICGLYVLNNISGL